MYIYFKKHVNYIHVIVLLNSSHLPLNKRLEIKKETENKSMKLNCSCNINDKKLERKKVIIKIHLSKHPTVF